MNRKNLRAFSELLDGLIDPAGFEDRDPIHVKADLMERLIEMWRIQSGHFENKVPFEQLYHSHLFVDTGCVHVVSSPSHYIDSIGTRPILLQPSLIIHLLLKHRDHYKVYYIIDSYIRSIRHELDVLDFKKTTTGVTRCFTNTRFAANTLRAYGFLKYTKNEAYKTWVLSLSGFVVASIALQKEHYSVKSIPSGHKELHPLIRDAWESVDTYEKFVETLRYLCKPNIDFFGSFKPMLREAHSLLNEYWKILKVDQKKPVDRKRESLALIGELERKPDIEKFYKEFSNAMNIEKFLKDIGVERDDPKPDDFSRN